MRPRGVAAVMLCVLLSAGASADDCTTLTGQVIGGAKVLATAPVAADRVAGLPGFCEVTAAIETVPGSRIGVVARLPDGWNGKLLGLGGGGWAGDETLARAVPGLRLHYATVQTDAGHPGQDLADVSWQSNPQARADFAWRAIHLTALAARQLVTRHYGQGARRAYFQGCSTGGRQGLIEAQRFPADFDGVIAGAPVYSFLTQTTMMHHSQAFAAPGASLGDAKLEWLTRTMLANCDSAEGARPQDDDQEEEKEEGRGRRRCRGRWCCGCRTRCQGRGSEAGGSHFVMTTPAAADAPPTLGNTAGGLASLRALLLGNAGFDLANFDPDADLAKLRANDFARAYEATGNTLSAFTRRGGKLLLWHGIDDPGPSPWATVDYYEAARHAARDRAHFDQAVRLYLAPGVQHCGGGPGADDFDLLSSLDAWVSSGTPPRIVASNRTRRFTRPLCAWPTLPRYHGGNADDAGSFTCEPP